MFLNLFLPLFGQLQCVDDVVIGGCEDGVILRSLHIYMSQGGYGSRQKGVG